MKGLILILILLVSTKKSLCQTEQTDTTVTTSTTEPPDTCGVRPRPVSCGNAVVLKGQSHIGIPAACFMKVDAGPCNQDLIRIYYDHHTYGCKAFSYSGCGGNANRFVSVKNCYKLCHPYYRQRFIGLSPDDKVTKKNNGTSPVAAKKGGSGGSAQSGKVSQSSNMNADVTNFSGMNLNETGTERNTSAEEHAEVLVVHEYDTYFPQPPQQLQPLFSPNARSFYQPYGYPFNPYAYSYPIPYTYPQQLQQQQQQQQQNFDPNAQMFYQPYNYPTNPYAYYSNSNPYNQPQQGLQQGIIEHIKNKDHY